MILRVLHSRAKKRITWTAAPIQARTSSWGTTPPGTLWSKDGKQLITTNDFKTRDGKKAQLTVARHLTGGGKALVLTLTLKIEGEPDGPPVKRIWRKKV